MLPPVTHAQHGPFLFTTKSIGRGMGGVPSIPDEETKTDYRALGSFLYMCCWHESCYRIRPKVILKRLQPLHPRNCVKTTLLDAIKEDLANKEKFFFSSLFKFRFYESTKNTVNVCRVYIVGSSWVSLSFLYYPIYFFFSRRLMTPAGIDGVWKSHYSLKGGGERLLLVFWQPHYHATLCPIAPRRLTQ
jgi:hypothetical protein